MQIRRHKQHVKGTNLNAKAILRDKTSRKLDPEFCTYIRKKKQDRNKYHWILLVLHNQNVCIVFWMILNGSENEFEFGLKSYWRM